MPESQDRLRLAAILAADVADYFPLMGQAERATVAIFTEFRKIFREGGV